MQELVAKRNELEAKQKALAGIFAEAGDTLDLTKVKSLNGDTLAKAAEIKGMNDELSRLGAEVDTLASVERAAKSAAGFTNPDRANLELPDGKGKNAYEGKSLGRIFVESKAFKSKGERAEIDAEVKALLQTTGGWAPETTRTGRVVEFATRPIQVIDVIPGTTTGQAAVVYMEETTFTNAATETAEAGTYPESALQLTQRSSTVRKIATFIPVTDEQLEDVPQVEAYVNNRLTFMLRQRLDSQILNGNGVGVNLLGFLNTAGIQTQAKGADPTPDAIYKALVKCRVIGRAMPNAVMMHPNDWQDVRLLKTADGIYLWGSPADVGPDRIWGQAVVQTDALPENTGLVGDFANFTELAIRRGIELQVSNSHANFFIEGKQAIRADMRAALVVYRPAALCTVTGI